MEKTPENIYKILTQNPVIGGKDNEISHSYILNSLERKGEFTQTELFEIVGDYMETIIKTGKRLDMLFWYIKDKLDSHEIDEDLKKITLHKIDLAIANNFEEFLLKNESDYMAKFSYNEFANMPLTQQKIKETGKDIFFKIRMSDIISLEKKIAVYEKYFGKIKLGDIPTVAFGALGEENVSTISQIMEELLEHSSEENRELFMQLGEGFSSTVFQVGDYVLKIGKVKNCANRDINIYNRDRNSKMDIIPNSPYIIQPIIRQYLNYRLQDERITTYVRAVDSAKEKTPGEHSYFWRNADNVINYIEVQNLVDMDWWKDKEESEINEILKNLRINLLKENLSSNDLKKGNVGRLLKKNTSHIYYYDYEEQQDGSIKKVRREIRPTQEGIRMEGEPDKILEAGEYVVVDTEYIERIPEEEAKRKIDKLLKETESKENEER